MLDPPPTATNPSHGPLVRAQSIAACIEASVGSTCTPSNTAASTPKRDICSATRCGSPVADTPRSVTTSARRTPSCARSKPISSDAPSPNFSAGAPYVKTDSVITETWLPSLGERAVRHGGAELAEDADRAERDAVDEHVGRRQVEQPADLRLGAPRVGDPGGLSAHPSAAERERRFAQRLDRRAEVVHDLAAGDL